MRLFGGQHLPAATDWVLLFILNLNQTRNQDTYFAEPQSSVPSGTRTHNLNSESVVSFSIRRWELSCGDRTRTYNLSVNSRLSLPIGLHHIIRLLLTRSVISRLFFVCCKQSYYIILGLLMF